MSGSIGNRLTFEGAEPSAGLRAAIAKSRGEIIDEVRASNIRGRGGAGFPIGMKWNLCAAAGGEEKYVVCNADEGEPGTFKDRVILEEFSHLVFEGMTIAGLAIGAKTGIVYLRGEYAYMLDGLEAQLEDRRREGLLGPKILGRDDRPFDIRIQLGAGAYVCGEETALIESLEGSDALRPARHRHQPAPPPLEGILAAAPDLGIRDYGQNPRCRIVHLRASTPARSEQARRAFPRHREKQAVCHERKRGGGATAA